LARVLVVDDDLQDRRVVRIALTVRGYDVREAANGFEALDEMRLAVVDVILMDWLMPGMDGEACRRPPRDRPAHWPKTIHRCGRRNAIVADPDTSDTLEFLSLAAARC
jgi:CheY-like chemotaxis protein